MKKTIALHRETLRDLNRPTLEAVVGGVSQGKDTSCTVTTILTTSS
jgi:hypothetical protein